MLTSNRPIALLFLALAACGGAPEEPAQPDTTPAAGTEAAPPAEAASSESWAVVPSSIRFDKENTTVFVQAALERVDDGAARTEPVHVGVTVITTTGEEIDLMVQTLFPGNFDAPVLFSAGVEADVQDVLIGAWGTRVEPCDVDRHGCKAFGFVLDDSLASWPQNLYTDGLRQRIPAGAVVVRVTGEPTAALEVSDAAIKHLEKELAIFGAAALGDVDARGAVAPSKATVRYAHASDHLMAASLAQATGQRVAVDVTVELGDTEGATFLIALE